MSSQALSRPFHTHNLIFLLDFFFFLEKIFFFFFFPNDESKMVIVYNLENTEK